MRRGQVAVSVVTLVLVSCGIRVASWPEQYAQAQCRFQQSCSALAFNELYSDLDDCVEESAEDVEDVLDALPSTCVFDRRVAADCVRAWGRAQGSCESSDVEDASEACAEVVSCGGDDGGGGGGGGGGLSADSFLEQYAELTCELAVSCAGGTQQQLRECKDAANSAWDEYLECEVVRADADDCLVALRRAADDCDFSEVTALARQCVDAFDCGSSLPGETGFDTF